MKLAIAEWKTARSRSHCRKNDDGYVKEVTRAALSSNNERFKIEVLRLLDGVEWPTASVILHFCDRGRYPILDVRALWSLGSPFLHGWDFTSGWITRSSCAASRGTPKSRCALSTGRSGSTRR